MNTCCTPRQINILHPSRQGRPTPRTVEIPSAEAVAKDKADEMKAKLEEAGAAVTLK